ncbi:MAG: hypothetical protein FJ263_09005 [Planctomycetes bacterium]|nr:hypothetical protein [Planctomycetota bacterium]
MMEQNPNTKTPDLIDTTDCLEAIDAIRSTKNFLFVLIILCLLVTGGIFALDRTDRIDRTAYSSCSICPMAPATPGCCIATKQPAAQTPALAPKAADVNEPAKTVAKQPDGSDPNAEFLTKVKDLFDSAGQNAAQKQLPAILRLRPACKDVALTLKTCNFILVLAATMYCLMLLMSLKISLTGRLGGISHICRAFFLSLFALVILLPWQVLLPGVVAGAIYTPHELLCQWHAKTQISTFWLVLCYLRFAGLWLLVGIVLIAAQLRARKWTKATLRRLGLVR